MNSNLLLKSDTDAIRDINNEVVREKDFCCKKHSSQKVEFKNIFTGDILGILGSLICLVHCLALPFIFSLSYSILPEFLLQDELIHLAILPFLFLTAFISFNKGYNIHHSKIIIALGVIGISLLVAGIYSHVESNSLDLYTIIGGLTLCTSHIFNIYKIKNIPLKC